MMYSDGWGIKAPEEDASFSCIWSERQEVTDVLSINSTWTAGGGDEERTALKKTFPFQTEPDDW